MMPYSFHAKRWMWRDEDAGPTTKYTGSGYRKRRVDRRLYNKRARRRLGHELLRIVKDGDR